MTLPGTRPAAATLTALDAVEDASVAADAALDTRVDALESAGPDAPRPVATTTAAYAVTTADTAGDALLRVDAAAGALTLTLPTAAAAFAAGGRRTVTVKKVDATGFLVTVQAAGGELIDGAATATFGYQYQTASFVTNGTTWDVL